MQQSPIAKVLLIIILILPTPRYAVSNDAAYLINNGDILSVVVWKEEELTREVIVLPDGMINFPLVGSIRASDQTVEDLQDLITKKLEKYIPDPVVTVSMINIAGNRIYVIGKVNKPGVIPMSQRIDVMQGLAMAGGLTPYANNSNIKILRRDGEKQKSIKFDYSDIEDGKKLDQNILLKSGDIIVIP
jgi:polysaccharide export outer membrane protein